MEWALAIPHEQAFKRFRKTWYEKKGENSNYLSGVKKILEKHFGEIAFSRLYFGQEFCERALCTEKELEKAVIKAEKHSWNFTFVTPYVTEIGLKKVKGLLKVLTQLKNDAEVVVNDWGVLEWVREHEPSFTPVLGRLLNKIIRDPRIPDKLLLDSTGQLRRFQTSSLAGEGMKQLLNEYNVKRVELDYPPQGLDPDLTDWGYDISLYTPYGVITTGRICLMQSWGLDEREKFRTNGDCIRPCKLGWLELRDSRGLVKESQNWTLRQKGNTVFYRKSIGFIHKMVNEMKNSNVNRMIIQPEPI